MVVLDERIVLCDSLNQLLGWVLGTVALRVVVLQGFVRATSSMWQEYPWLLQIRLCARYAAESFTTSCAQMCAVPHGRGSKPQRGI